MIQHDVVIVGGGLAGLTAALSLSNHGYNIAVFENSEYPHHKVCGEYLSNEVVPYLNSLGVDLLAAGAVSISDFIVSSANGKVAKSTLPLGGIGISRYVLDHLLFKTASQKNIQFYFERVVDITRVDGNFRVKSYERSVKSPLVIGAYGKRSGLDKKLDRRFISKKNDWLAVKMHYNYPNFPKNLVALHNFKGGYGGLSKTESGHVNFCYLVKYDIFKAFKDIDSFNQSIVSLNPHLKSFLSKAKPVFEKPLSIGQISFGSKRPVENHILMCGDTAGLIHPLCGNGMAMAIHSGKLVSECIQTFFNRKGYEQSDLEKDYLKLWNQHFKSRLRYGNYLQKVLMQERLVNWGISNLGTSQHLLHYLIERTHGKVVLS